MKKVKITAVKAVNHSDLSAIYENAIEHTCDVKVGDVFISEDAKRPNNLCESAWQSMKEFVEVLANGGGNFYDGWMKNKKSAMISCNDGFRPVSFYIEALDEDAE